jgi:hypothetical protein
VLAGLLFLGYLRESWTVAVTSDGAAQALQARDMLAGNWLLHGWTVSDVSFYTTELPEYVLVELVRPLGAGVVHVAAAVTYTLLVLGACALARGRAHGAEGLVRGLLAAGIMLAPQLGYGAFVLLLSPDHVGTQVPLLLGWLLLDLAQPAFGRAASSEAASRGPASGISWVRRWWVPAALCLLLAWVQFADRVAIVTAVLPLVLVCLVSLVRKVTVRRPMTLSASRQNPARTRARADREEGGSLGAPWCVQRSTVFPLDGSAEPERASRPKSAWREGSLWPAGWYEVALAGAAVGSVAVAWAGARVLAGAGGFTGHPLPFTLAPLRLLWTHAWLTGWGVLEVYGANFLGVTGWAGRAFAVLHLCGLALAIAGTAVALWRSARSRRADLVDSVLAMAIVANLVSYVLSVEPGTVIGTGYDAREIAAVLPLGAVLAGRVFGPRLLSLFRGVPVTPSAGTGHADGQRALTGTGRGAERRRNRSGGRGLVGGVLALVMAGYGVAFGYSAAQAEPGAASADAVLAGWLAGHGLRYGLGGASANVVSLESGGRAAVAAVAVSKGRVRPLLYQSSVAAYDPGLHDATFVVTRAPAARPGDAAEDIPAAAVRATFGPPARVYRFDGFTVDVWGVNLLTKMRG